MTLKFKVVLEDCAIDVPIPVNASAPLGEPRLTHLLLAAILEISRLQQRLARLEGKPVGELPDFIRL